MLLCMFHTYYCIVCFTAKCTRVTVPTNVYMYLYTVLCYLWHAATDAVLVIIIIIMSIVP